MFSTNDPGPNRLTLDRVEARGESFDGKTVDVLAISRSTFERCVFSDFNLKWAGFGGSSQSVFRRCVFDSMTIADSVPGNVRFEECDFSRAHLKKWLSFSAEYVRCRFSGRIDQGFIWARDDDLKKRTRRTTNEVLDNDFRECLLGDFSFRGGVELKRHLLPDGPGYLWIPDLKAFVTSIDSAESGANPLSVAWGWLSVLRLSLKGGQRQYFGRPDEPPPAWMVGAVREAGAEF